MPAYYAKGCDNIPGQDPCRYFCLPTEKNQSVLYVTCAYCDIRMISGHDQFVWVQNARVSHHA